MYRIVFVALVTMLASGCATITRGTSEAYAIETTPPGAHASLSTGLSCNTPCSLKVKRRGDFTINITKEGYEPVVATITSSIDGAGGAGMAGNVLIGGIIGMGVDAGSGAMHSHKPNPLVVTMSRIGEGGGSTNVDEAASSGSDPGDIMVGEAAESESPDADAAADDETDADELDPLDME